MFKKGIFIPRSIQLFAEGEGGQPGGSGDAGKVLESFQNKLTSYNNDAMVMARQLFSEAYQLREDKRKLKAKVEELQGKQPAADAVVLSADEAKTWAAIKELNLSADDIKQRLQSSSDTATELAALKRKDVIREAADLEGYKANVLGEVIAADLAVEFKEVERDGKNRRTAFVKVKENGADKELPLSEYLESNKKDFLPALRVEQKQETRFIRQDGTGSPPSTNRYEQIREDQKQRQEAKKQEGKSLEQRLGMA